MPERSMAPASAIEQRTIEYIPEGERHGSVRSLFTVWFAANMQVTTIVVGALGVIVGLALPWALLALLVGNVFGAIFMALHSAQGPKLGIPQMIQSRAQFGFYGAIVPLILVLLMYLGFYASGVVLGGQAVSSWLGLPFWLSAVLMSAVITVLTVYGYRVIHRLERIVSAVAVVVFAFLTYRILTQYSVGDAWSGGGDFHLGTFLLVVSIAATWQITYAPYVADYSRYLPAKTSVRAAFWWTYTGTVSASTWMMALGSIAVAVAGSAFDEGSSDFLVGLAPGGLHWAVSVVVILGILAIQVLNLYGMFMSSTTTLTALRSITMNTSVRTVFVTASAVVGTVIGIAGRGGFVTNLENFVLFLAYFLIPWTAINLADFYWVRREQYDMRSIFTPDGIYGRVNGRTMIAYLIAVLLEIPFASTTFYTGPLVSHLGGADIAWIVGAVSAALLYLALPRDVALESRASRNVGPVTEEPAV